MFTALYVTKKVLWALYNLGLDKPSLYGKKKDIKVFDFVKDNTPGAYFSIMNQYIPLGRANEFPGINRKVTPREYEKVLNYIIESGFKNCLLQEIGSADKRYIPNFDLSGV